MKIRLKEIPAEGRSYEFDRVSGELNAVLEDLVDERPYLVKMVIKPIGNAYELRGNIQATLSEVCSTCGWDFELPVGRDIHEILFEEQDEYRKNHSVHGNQSVDFLANGPSMFAYRGDIFDAGEFAHEVIALAEPFYPTCGSNGDCLRKEEVEKIRHQLESEFAAAEEKKAGHPAFSVLKGLDLNKKN
jgi:uncharacterized protein